ncbi:MAG: tRNA 2-thiocytidine biosynthesis protein TtcA [Oscillospiraceae bacterium]|nr:tRNA 2-thiocytidine biosynthesis protein TtcA [Oscillospiraceae bacterium]
MSDLNKLTGFVRRCVQDYDMIQQGDTVAVGVSGGKDSLTLLCALTELSRYYPKEFSVHAITVDMGYEGMDFSGVQRLCDELKVPYTVRKTYIKQIIFDSRHEKNPCALCAKMRRGAIHDVMGELGIKKIALGHHFDDAVETFLLSLLYEGRISCFEPVTYLDRTGVTQIRPMLYVGEGTVRNFARDNALPVVFNPCPMDGNSKRQEVKELIGTLSADYPRLKTKIFTAMQNLPLSGWEKPGTNR